MHGAGCRASQFLRRKAVTVAVSSNEIVAAWERVEAGASLSVRRQNRLVDRADRLVERALADEVSLQGLLAVLDSAATPERLKQWLRGRILPLLATADHDPGSLRAHPLVDLSAEAMPIRRCLALVETDEKIKTRRMLADPESPECMGWLAGRAAAGRGPTWPESSNGEPLTHIVAIDLAATDGDLGGRQTIFADLDLPTRGVLQLFHDLETCGDEPDDADAHAWQVQWVEQPAGLQKLPGTLKCDYRDPAPVSPQPALSILPLDAVGLQGEERKRYAAIFDHIEDDLRSPVSTGSFTEDTRPSRWESGYIPEAPTSRIGGFGHRAWNDELEELLTDVLPLDAGDEYSLLFDIAGVRHLEGWFGDSGHLQVWIRRSDLRVRRFDQVWCIIRNG